MCDSYLLVFFICRKLDSDIGHDSHYVCSVTLEISFNPFLSPNEPQCGRHTLELSLSFYRLHLYEVMMR